MYVRPRSRVLGQSYDRSKSVEVWVTVERYEALLSYLTLYMINYRHNVNILNI